jgi:hypothetical protein
MIWTVWGHRFVFLFGLAGLFLGCQKAPELTLRQREENRIREAVFRHQIENNRPAMLHKPSIIYLAVEQGKDPDRTLMNRFRGHDPAVEPASEHPGIAAARSGTGKQKFLFTIDSIRWISDKQVEVRARTDQDGAGGTGIYTLEPNNAEWVVTMEHITLSLAGPGRG